jgi:hypothetical protein
MGAKHRHTKRAQVQAQLDELRTQITAWYMDEKLSSVSIQEKLVALELMASIGQIQFALHRYELRRPQNHRSSRVFAAASKRRYADRLCEHCHSVYTPKGSTQVFCSICAPDSSFWKKIKIHGVNKPMFDEMLRNQNSMCGVCAKPLGNDIDIDHDHETLQIRGLLHRNCNLRLAAIEDDEFVLQAQAYLKRTKV